MTERKDNRHESLRLKYRLAEFGGPINQISWSPDGKRLACSCHDGKVYLWDATYGSLVGQLQGHNGIVYGNAWSPMGDMLASCSHDGRIIVWDSNTREQTQFFVSPRLPPDAISVSQEGDFSTEWAMPRKTIGIPVDPLLFDVAWKPKQQVIATACNNNRVFFWDLKNPDFKRQLDGHDGAVYCVCWSPEGLLLASASADHSIRLWDGTSGKLSSGQFLGHRNNVLCLAWSPDGQFLASGSDDHTVRIWNRAGDQLNVIEAHTGSVISVAFSFDGRLLASKSRDGTVAIWSVGRWDQLAVISEPTAPENLLIGGLAFHPDAPLLATLGEDDSVARIWDVDLDALLSLTPGTESVRYTTAKIVVVGDSGVGKTGLAWRLAHDSFREHASTHGQQFWVADALSTIRSDGAVCETVLWDLAGQPDYRLVHSVLLEDVDLALILFDPSNRENPLGGVEFWLNQLSYGRHQRLKTILVAARVDRGAATLTRDELDAYCKDHDISGGYIETSAKNGDGIQSLVGKIKKQIPWDDLPSTITTTTFKRIKDFVLKLKEHSDSESTVVLPDHLRSLLKAGDAEWEFSDRDMMTAVRHLATHGYVTLLRNSHNAVSVLLAPDVLTNLASSIVLEARRNPRGLGALEESGLLGGEYLFPEIESLSVQDRNTLLDSATILFVGHNLCFRQTFADRTLLIFPSLINEKRPRLEKLELVDDVSYHVTGAVENVYASLVVLLGYTNTFTRSNQWLNQARYELATHEICGFSQVAEREGEIELILQYGIRTSFEVKQLFQGLFERFLRRKDVAVFRYPAVVCDNCSKRQERAVVRNVLNQRKNDLFCNQCGREMTVPTADELFTNAEKSIVNKEQAVAGRRTTFEAAVVRIKRLMKERNSTVPRCFISYAWGIEHHERWVLSLAKDLRNAGVKVVFDRWCNPPGTPIDRFIEEISNCDYIIVVGTPLLRKKYEARRDDPVVRAELELINAILMRRSSLGNRVIPILLDGGSDRAFTPQMVNLVHLDFRSTGSYFVKLVELISTVFELPRDDPRIEDILNAVR